MNFVHLTFFFHEETKTDSAAGAGRASPVFLRKHPFRKSYQFSPSGCGITPDSFKALKEGNNSYNYIQVIDMLMLHKKEKITFLLNYFKIQRCDGNENVTKNNKSIGKTISLHVHHTFLYICLPFLHYYDVKMPNFAFYSNDEILFLSLILNMVHLTK